MCPAPVQQSDVHKTMHAQVSVLIKHHQLMVRYDADHISPSTASSDSTHKPCDQCELKQSTALTCAEQQCTHNWVTLAAGVADLDILLIQHHQLLMKHAAQPSSSIIASSADTTDNLVTDVHCSRSMCAQSNYKRSDVHNTNASISGCLM